MKKDYSLLKTLLFVAGLVIIIAAAILFYPLFPIKIWKHILIWFDIASIYCAVFLPIVIRKRNIDNTDKVFVGGAIYYRGVIIYAIISLALVIIAFKLPLSYIIIIIAQCAAVIVFLVYLFTACFTVGHLGEVEQEENQKLAMVKTLRMQSTNLAIKANGLGDGYGKVKEAANTFADNMRYLSPSNDPEAIDLERKMSRIISSIANNPIFLTPMNSPAEPVLEMFRELNVIFEQRKSLL